MFNLVPKKTQDQTIEFRLEIIYFFLSRESILTLVHTIRRWR